MTGAMTAAMTGALQRTINRAVARRGADVDRCGLCGGPVAAEHRHVLDDRAGQPPADGIADGHAPADLQCVCVPCTLLFDRTGAGGGHYQLVPQRRARVGDAPPAALGVPVGLAFFVKQGDGRVLAHYPSPLGATRAEVDTAAWAAVETGSAMLRGMRPRVEAFLVWTASTGQGTDRWIVPVDEAYRLAGLVRTHWQGMSGGTALWREVARFFQDLDRRTGGSARSKQ
jgi:Family of unknown function (DUF5947)